MAASKLSSWRFWLITAVTAATALATLNLGFWQLRRAAAKQQIASSIEAQNQLPALDNAALIAMLSGANSAAAPSGSMPEAQGAAPWVHRRASLRGQWLHESTVYLDNRNMTLQGSHRYGFYVVTPLLLEGSSAVLWVQRGWVPRHFQDRQLLPPVPQASGTVQVEGRLMSQVSRIYELQSDAPTPPTAPSGTMPSKIWQNLPAVDFRPRALLPAALLQGSSEIADPSDTLQRQWPAIDTGVAKHHGYAFQWFALSGTLLILYVWFQFIAPRRRKA
jgi:surfeit locus 1 family protein